MILSNNIKSQIKECLINHIDKQNHKRYVEKPFNLDNALIKSPFNARLVPQNIWKASKYERSFVTGFGNIYEDIAKIIAFETWGSSVKQYKHQYIVYKKQLEHINSLLDELDHPVKDKRRYPDWKKEKEELDKLQTGPKHKVEVISDVYLYSKLHNKQAFIEIKSPKPNKDQSKVSKAKMLKIYCGTKSSKIKTDIFFSLPFNPYVKREEYNFSFPGTYFNMKTSKCVNMGKEFWDYVGGEKGTYEELLSLIEEIGLITKRKIKQFQKYGLEMDEVYQKLANIIEAEIDVNEKKLIDIINQNNKDPDEYKNLIELVNDESPLTIELLKSCLKKENKQLKLNLD